MTTVVVALLLVAVVVGFLAYPWLRPGGSAGKTAVGERLLQDIADLDDAYERGEISEKDYTQRCSLLKARLVEIMRSEDA